MCDFGDCEKPSKKTYTTTRHTIGVFRQSSPSPGSMLSKQSNRVCEECYNDIIAGKKMPMFSSASRFPEMDAATRRKMKEKEKRESRVRRT